MKRKYVFYSLFIPLAFIILYLSFPGDERQIKKRFALLTEYAAKDQNENILDMAQRAKKISSLFSERVKLEIPEFEISGTYTRQDVVAYAAQGRLSFSRLSLQFSNLRIVFSRKGEAEVTSMGRLTGKSVQGEDVDESRKVRWILKKIEDQWYFSAMDVEEAKP